MEQTVAETQSQEQLHGQYDGPVNSSGAHFLHHPSPRSWTGRRGTSTHTASLGGDHLGQDKALISICRDNLRGTCARGASCKYRHAESGEHGGSRFYQSEHGASGVANLGNSLSYGETKDNYSKTRFASEGYRSRSPCRRFQRGACYRGASCSYLHPEVIRYDTPTYSASVEQQQVQGALRVPGFGEEDRNNASRISLGQEEADKENYRRTMTISGRRSRSPCRDFLRGNCIFGSNCRRLHPVNTFVRSRTNFISQHNQGLVETANNFGCNEGLQNVALRTTQRHDESNMHNSVRTGTFLRERRRRSPCRNFQNGKCHRGESCAYLHHSPVDDRRRYDLWRTQQRDGVPETSGTAHFNDGTVRTISRSFQNHEDHKNHGIQPRWDMQIVKQNDQEKSTTDSMQWIGNRENMNVISGSWFSEGLRHKNSNASDSGGDRLLREPEVCLRFTRGRCYLGDSCRYLHGYHKYASSNWSTRPTGAAADSRNLGVANQHANTVMIQQHNGVINAARLNNFDQKGDASVMDGKKCEIPEENSAGLCSSAEGHEGISLWSQPFKRRRSRSRSPLTPRNDIRCMNFRRYDSRMDLRRDRCYNVARFQYPDCRSHTSERPMYHANGHQNSTNAGTSMNPCYVEKYDSKLVGPQRLDEVVNHDSQIASASKKDETDSATLALEPSHIDQNDKELAHDNIAVDRLQGAAANSQGDLKLDSAISCKDQLVSPESICLSMLDKEGNVEETNDNTAEVMPSVKSYFRKNIRKRGQESPSCEETMNGGANISKQQEYGSIIENIEKNVEPTLATAEASRRKLLVLDVNGLLADIVELYPFRYKPDTIVSTKGVFKRPFCDDFLQFCFERYNVGIWSSRTMRNVTRVVDFLMKDTQNRLMFCWDQSHCTATGYNTIENREKPLVLKELKKLWDNKGESLPWKKGYYNETNTILLDDSPYKALRNPPYTAIFPHPYTFKDAQDKSLGPGGDLRVYLERLAEAENVQKFIQENPFGQRPITKANLSWAFYAKIINSISDGNLKEEKVKVGSDGIQLEENANIVGTSDKSQLDKKDEIVCTSNGSLLEENAKIVGTSDRSGLEEKAKIICISDGNLLEENAKVGSDGIQLEKKANIVGISDGSQLEEKDEIVGTSNGNCLEENAEIVGTSDRSRQEEKAKIISTSDGNLLEERGKVVSDIIQLEEKANIVGKSDGSQLDEKVESVGTSSGSLLEGNAEIVDTSDRSELEAKA